MLRLYQRMKPEERLVAFFHHAQLTQQMCQAGVRYRAGPVLSLRSQRQVKRKKAKGKSTRQNSKF